MKLLSNVRWISLSQGARVLTQLISVTVLARLLSPEDYGLMAMATVVVNFAYLFRDLGTGAALIQMPRLRPTLVDTLHWSNFALSLLIMLGIIAGAPIIATFFHTPALVPVLTLLALMFPLAGLGVVRQALLERESSFARLALLEVAAASIGLVLALVLAWQGAGVYSLVGQSLVAALVSTGLLAASAGFRPKLRWRWSQLRSLVGFSGNLSLFNSLLYVSRNADSMVVGRLLGGAALGVYSLAYRIMLFPVQNMGYVAARALYPVLSRQQDDRAAMARLYLKTTGFIAFVAAPLMAGLFVLREPFVLAVFGPHWHAVTAVLAWLAPVGFVQAVLSTSGTVFMARGRTDLMLRLGLFATALQVAAFFIGAHWGIEGVAAAYLLANLINALPALHYSARLLDISLADVLRTLALPLAGALAMVALLMAAQALIVNSLPGVLPSLFGCVLLGMVIYLIAALIFLRPQMQQLRLLLHTKQETT